MKKFLLAIAIFALLFLLASCGSNFYDKNKASGGMDTQDSYNVNSSEETDLSVSAASDELQSTDTTTQISVAESISTTVATEVIVHATIVTELSPTAHGTLSKYGNTLFQLNSYQQQYFEICRMIEDNKASVSEGRSQIDGLFTGVTSEISQSNEYYKRYIRIEPDLEENRYGYEDVSDDYFYNPVNVYIQQYQKYDELLNDLYLYIKSQIPTDSFEGLKGSEMQWIKDKERFLKSLSVDENDRYALAYKAEMTKYRCLLLMLYLGD